MARVTVEDCLTKVNSRFELVVLAAQRSREIASGAEITLARSDDKNPVVALREIASGNIQTDTLRSNLVESLGMFFASADQDEALEQTEIGDEVITFSEKELLESAEEVLDDRSVRNSQKSDAEII